MYITYYAPDTKLHNCEDSINKSEFRGYADTTLKEHYPSHTITISQSVGSKQVDTDDSANLTEIQVYCSKLWPTWHNMKKTGGQ